MTLPSINFLAVLPQTIVIATALLVLLVDAVTRSAQRDHQILPWISLLGLVAAAAAAIWLLRLGQPQLFQQMAVADGYSLAFMLLILAAGLLGVLLAQSVIPAISPQAGAYYALLLLGVAGMMFMGAALDLLVVFLALEIMSLALYILVGFNREERRSAEAALKYFLLGAFSSGFFLFGVALLYAVTGSTHLPTIAAALALSPAGSSLYLTAALALLIVGFGFKVALVPFHMWTPDAYQGAPTPVTAFMSVATKAAAFAAFLRVFALALPAAQPQWGMALAVLAAFTMTLGNLAALRQNSMKRMLAYSSIAHAGYALVGLVPASSQGVSGVLFYLLGYLFMNLGAFAVVVALERPGENDVPSSRFVGLAERQPAMAAAMAIFMFSLAGIPPFAGFLGKFFVFSAAIQAGWGWLVVIGVLNSVLSAFYYLTVIVQMYFRKANESHTSPVLDGKAKKSKVAVEAAAASVADITESVPLPVAVVVLLAALGTALVGLWPSPWTHWITQAVSAVFG
ncbi:MAG: NADH-quinone oxidoreductase subunit N [Caldilineales bacterium]